MGRTARAQACKMAGVVLVRTKQSRAAMLRRLTRRVRLRALTLLALVLALGCAHAPLRDAALPANALPVPLVRQATSWSCGAAALLAVLYYWRAYDGNESSLWGPLDTTEKDGTEPDAIARVARAHGLAAELREGVGVDELRAAVAAGRTVIVDLQAWRDDARRGWADDWDDGHYVVLVAVDGGRAWAMDPSTDAGYAYLPLDELGARWHDVDRAGRRFSRLAIFVSGRAHLPRYPAPPTEMR